MQAPEIKLYSMLICPFAQRTRIHLELLGLPFELVDLDICRPRPEWFLRLSPAGQVPALVYGDDVVCDSSIIAEYLQEVAPSPLPFGSGPAGRAAVRSLVRFVDTRFIPALYLLMAARTREERDLRERAALDTWRWLDEWLAKHAGPGPFGEEDFGMAEVSIAPFFLRYEVVRHYQGFELAERPEFARVLRWHDALLGTEIVRSTAESVPDLIKLYEDYTLGYFNGAVPPGRERSSLDLTVPPSARPLPAPVHSGRAECHAPT